MSTEISVRGSDPGPSARSFLWPVLEAGNGSFENGIYSIVCEDKEKGKSFMLRHSVQGAPLIQDWIVSNRLFFVCTVSAPRSMYRKLHSSQEPEQTIQWNPEDLGEYPMFTPMLVVRDEIVHTVNAESDGLNRIWDGKKLSLPRGARVAIGPTFKFQSGIRGILDFTLDERLDSGQFLVEASSEDGFKFKVHLAPDLHEHLRYHRQELTGENIMVHVVSTVLSILQRDYSQDDDEESWQSYRNLVGLADLLEEKRLGHWADEGFRPEWVATRLHPHKLPKEGN